MAELSQEVMISPTEKRVSFLRAGLSVGALDMLWQGQATKVG